MPNFHRVVITGIGAVTPIGNNIDEYLVGLQTGTNGVSDITLFDPEQHPCKFAAEVKNLQSENYIEANPLVTPAHIVPEWYLLPFYAILRSVPDKLLGVVAMLSAILILAALPWLDTSKIRSAVFRPLYKQFYWILVADVLILGYVGAMPAEGLYLLIARVATAYYFLHFLVILPVLGFKEKTLPVPLSITEPVLGGSPNLAAARNRESKIE